MNRPHRPSWQHLTPARLRLPHRTRGWVGATTAALVTAGVIAVGVDNGFPAPTLRLTAGAAWLRSNQTGQVVLLDGASAEVVTRISIGRPGAALYATQQDRTGYVVNGTDGSVTRVDGATLATTRSTGLFDRPGNDLRIAATANALYAVDGQRGLLVKADPRSLTADPRSQPLSARLDADRTAVDPAGTLWVINPETRELVWFAAGERHRRADAVSAHAGLLTLAGDRPVLLDPAGQRADLLDPTSGAVVRSLTVELRADDQVSLSAGIDRDRLHVVVAGSRGLLFECSFAVARCQDPMRLGAGGELLGPAVESGGRILVPNYTTGRVWIINRDALTLIDDHQLLTRAAPFDLINREGFVFYNDPASEQAGVIALDGTVHRVDKYQAVQPGPGTDQVPTGNNNPVPPQDRPPQPGTNNPDQRIPGATTGGPGVPGRQLRIAVRPGLHGVVGDEFQFTAEATDGTPITGAQWTFGDGQTGRGPAIAHSFDRPGTFQVAVSATLSGGPNPLPASISVTIGPRAAPPVIANILIAPESPVIGQSATFSAEITGSQPTGWTWTITAPDGHTEATSTAPRFNHAFPTAGSYQLTLAVTAPSGTNRRNRTFEVAPPNIHCGDTIAASLVANVDLTCPGDGLIVGANGITIDLGGHTITGPGSGTGLSITNHRDVTIRNGTFANFNTGTPGVDPSGVVTDNAPNGKFSGVQLRDCSLAILNNSDGAIVTDSTFTSARVSTNFSNRLTFIRSRFNGGGLGLSNQTQSMVSQNTFTGSMLAFIESGDSAVTNNTFIDSPVIAMIVANIPNISGNTFRGAASGVRIGDMSNAATITGNSFTGSMIGVRANENTKVINNTFVNNGAAGVLVEAGPVFGSMSQEIRDNTFTSNGHQSGGMTDRAGHPVNDGLHINAQAGVNVIVTNNHARDNADFGIEAYGSITDGGGNTSSGDPSGCLGVACS